MTMAMTPARFFLLMTALFAALATWFVPRMDASGDEPHYLLMAKSLWLEGDLDLRDNYEREDWREFRSGRTEPHYAAPRRDGRPFPGHAPGLPFLLAPFYALGGRLACVIFLGALVAGVGALVFRLALAEGLSRRASGLGALFAAGPPLAAFSLHAYTEAAAAFALLAAYCSIRLGGRALGPALASLFACLLPFLHPRMAIVSIAIAFVAWRFKDRVAWRVFAAVSALGALLYAAFWMSIFGVPTALGMYGGVPDDAALNPFRALVGLLFDRAYGILPYAPAFAALFVLAWPRPSTPTAAKALQAEIVLVLAILLPVLFWRMWWGGQSPPARLIAPMTPFLALWLARVWGDAGVIARRVIIAGALWSWALFLFAALQPDRLLFINRRVRPTRIWDALWPGGPLDSLLPDMARPLTTDWALAAAWLVLLIIGALSASRSASQ